MKLYDQASFVGGLNSQFDSAKASPQTYPLAFNVRMRKNTIASTPRHKLIEAPPGAKQGIFAIGSIIVVIIGGVAYYLDTLGNNTLHPVANWTSLDSTAKVFFQPVPATINFMNRLQVDNPAIAKLAFNGSIAAYPESVIVQNRVDRPRSIRSNLGSAILADYGDWTLNNPEYVPIGGAMAWNGSQLYTLSPDGRKIFRSVSGRPTDHVINIDSEGQKGGDANTTATGVSFNPGTGLFASDTGDILVTTLEGTFKLVLDYDQAIFNEPYPIPQPLFPVGCVNERSFARILGDTTFISQNGIQRFNTVAQTFSESNSSPLGARIRGILANPQSDTAATNFDLYALFSVNTVHGRGVLIYDETLDTFASLDDSFGHATQFAVAKANGKEKLFFITADDALYEAYAGDGVNTSKVYIGEITSGATDTIVKIEEVKMIFTDIRTSGHVKIIVYADGKRIFEAVQGLTAEETFETTEIESPFNSRVTTKPVEFQFDPIRGMKIGVMVEWTADAALTALGMHGDTLKEPLQTVTRKDFDIPEKFAILGGTGYGENLAIGEGWIAVTAGRYYLFQPIDAGVTLVNGNQKLTEMAKFKAQGVFVMVSGAGTYYLQDCTDLMQLVARAGAEGARLIGAGNHTDSGTEDQAKAAFFFTPLIPSLAGPRDKSTNNGQFVYSYLQRARHYRLAFDDVEFFFYDGDPNTPDGSNVSSIQAISLKTALANSTRRFKIIINAYSPYSADVTNYPGITAQRLPYKQWGACAVISSMDALYERFDVDGLTYINCGRGGTIAAKGLTIHDDLVTAQDSGAIYLLLEVDGVEAKFTAKTTAGVIVDQHTITI